MATKDEHVTWAHHNNSFWTSFDINATPFTDWVVTGIFYEALHWVEAFLATKGYHSGTHRNRQWNITHFQEELGRVQANEYNTLKWASEGARYRCHKFTPKDVQEMIPLLDDISSHISGLL